jgi:putative transposase
VQGINRRKIFFDNRDRVDFLDRIANILTDTQPSCFALSLMATPCHLLLRTGTVPIVTAMRRLLTGDAVRFDRR